MSAKKYGRRARVRRQRQGLATVFVLLVAVSFVALHNHFSSTPTTSSTLAPIATTSTTSPTSTTAVGTITLHLSEPASASEPERVLDTTVRYPAIGSPGGSPIAGAAPLHNAGPYPLVVFSQGFGVAPQNYAHLLNAWAAAGYVVADPAYPFTSPNSPGGLRRTDIVHHPADLSFVVTSLLDASAQTSGALSGLINSAEVGLIGHSDGGDVTLALAANACCRDSRIKAAIILSGAELAWFNGTYFAPPAVPMLVVQGSADENMNPVACSVELYNAAHQPKYYLSMIGQTHFSAYLPPGPALQVVKRVTIDFLNAYLRGAPSSLANAAVAGTVPGLATFTSASSLAPVAGSCPGAPAG